MAILPENRAQINPSVLFLILVFMSGLGPFSLQIFLPALPSVAESFEISFSQAQLALSLSMVAIALGMLVTGPLADSYGRRSTVIIGTILFLIGSAICILCWDIYSLIFGRIIQAFGGAAGVVISRAVLRDLYADAQNARAMSFVVVAMVVGPGIAPLFGASLTEWVTWRSVFIPSLIFGVGTLVYIILYLKETAPSEASGQSNKVSLWNSWKILFSSRLFTYLNFVAACSISVFYSVVSGASFAVQEFMNGGPLDYGFLLIGMSSSFISGNLVSGNVVLKYGALRLVKFGLALGLFATLLIFTLISFGVLSKILLLFSCMLFAVSNGFVVSNAQSAAINEVPLVAGKASGLIGFTQMFVSAIVVQLVAYWLHLGPITIAISMVMCASAAMVLFHYAVKEA